MVPRRRRAWQRFREPTCFSTPARLAGTLRRRRAAAKHNGTPGAPFHRSHAVANGLYVAAVNRVGHEVPATGGPGIEFWGSSLFADPQGIVVAEAPDDQEATLFGQVDLERLEEVRRDWPFLRDRRIEAYAGLTSRYLDKAP